AITDHHGLYGMVRFEAAARRLGIKPIFGTELTLTDEAHLVLLARNQAGLRNLCKIITRAHLDSEYTRPRADLNVIAEHQEGLFILTGCHRGPVYRALREEGVESARAVARRLKGLFGPDKLFIEMLQVLERFDENQDNHRLAGIAESLGLRTVATNDVHQAERGDYPIQDTLSCIRLIQRVTQPSPERFGNAERFVKSEREMGELFGEFPEAVRNAEYIARQCDVTLESPQWRLPKVETPMGVSAMTLLKRLASQGLERRLRGRAGPEYEDRLHQELALIEEMGFVDYFLICHDIVRAARSMGVRTTGRGSAGNSLVAFALGLVAPDPIEHGMIFQRFMNRERRELPDVDIDFCSRRRDEVLDYVYQRYGEDNVAAVATLNTFRARSAIRETAKALGYSPEEIDEIARVFPFLSTRSLRESFESTPEIRNFNLDLEAISRVVRLADKITGYPRHLGIHVGGIVISDRILTDYVPLQWSAKGIVICQFDKDDVEALKLVKLDLLGLRMHSAMERCLDLVEERTGLRPDIDSVALDDTKTYELMQEAKTVGCFQLESPGERSLQARLRPRIFKDVIANISLFRPGPVQADMVTPFVERRNGREPVNLPHPSLEPILGETYGVITYQEQVLQVANAVAGFSLAEADSLRRAMTKHISEEKLAEIRDRFLSGAEERGYGKEDAEGIFRQIQGFAAYGFCKGHAACFGLIAYQSAYLKAHHAAEFLAGVLSNQPMGYYPARTLIEDAKRFGIPILRVDVNRSEVQYSTEGDAVRIGLIQVRNLSERSKDEVVAERERGGRYGSVLEFCRRVRVDRDSLENLILSGAFDELPAYGSEPEPRYMELPSGVTDSHQPTLVRADALLHRRRLLWMLPFILRAAGPGEGEQRMLPDMGPDLHERERRILESLGEMPDVEDLANLSAARMEKELIMADYTALHLSPLRHPLALVRPRLEREGAVRSLDMLGIEQGRRVRSAGVVVSRNRPPTKSGRTVVFVTLEDEVGLFDAVVFEETYKRTRHVLFGHDTLMVEGRLDRPGGTAVSLMLDKVQPLNPFEGGKARPDLGAGPGDHSGVRIKGQRIHCTEQDDPATWAPRKM
ncbi:MAG: DNA polymerase III subunit alpha, partial [Armatimonadia bacterium]|nr:DNA polymerase III subunit alpha [Armatimonadia bacterium]